MAGVTSTGFTPMRLQEIKLALETALQGVFGDINLESTSVFGQFIGVMSKIMADWWEGLEDVYLSEYPATAAGAALDNSVALVGITRLPAIKTTVTCQLDGTATTVVPSGSQVGNTNGDLFTLLDDVTIPGDGEFEALAYGAVPAVASTVTTIVTPVSGWDTVDNTDAGVIGREEETDAELRQRREQSLSVIGAGTVESIRSRIINTITEVTECAVFENTADITDPVSNRPPHSLEIVVLGGDDQEIADLIWQIKPGGIQLYNNPSGGVTKTVVDSNGDNQTIYFTRPTTMYAHVKVDINTYSTEETFPLDGVDQIKAAILEYSSNLSMGKDMLIQKWYSPVYSVPGLSDVTISHAITPAPGDTPSWETTNIEILATEDVYLSLARITVNP
jgi:uncharacterized phage protein gp47/JayE